MERIHASVRWFNRSHHGFQLVLSDGFNLTWWLLIFPIITCLDILHMNLTIDEYSIILRLFLHFYLIFNSCYFTNFATVHSRRYLCATEAAQFELRSNTIAIKCRAIVRYKLGCPNSNCVIITIFDIINIRQPRNKL